MTKETADKYDLTTVSDLAGVPDSLDPGRPAGVPRATRSAWSA